MSSSQGPSRRVAAFRDPMHGFIRADPLETALINSRPVQRLRWIRQLGLTYLVFPGAEHSRFSHVLGAMDLAGRVYDALAARATDLLDPDPRSRSRRLARAAALLHDIGHPPFSHSSEDHFEEAIHHETMTRRLLTLPEMSAIFDAEGDGITVEDVVAVLDAPRDPSERLLSQIVAGELDVDKMDYLLRDSMHCGVRYGSYDLPRLIDTIRPLRDPDTGDLGLGVSEGGVHALEALVMARYYMFTQVYFNAVGKAFELHLTEWLKADGLRWPVDPEAFLQHDDISTITAMRRSPNRHARAVIQRRHDPVAWESSEHLTQEEKQRFEAVIPELHERFGAESVLVANSRKDPHRLGRARVFVQEFGGELVPMEEASHFIRHLETIDRYRVYCQAEIREAVREAIDELVSQPG